MRSVAAACAALAACALAHADESEKYPSQCRAQAVCGPVLTFEELSAQGAKTLGGDFKDGTMIVTTSEGSAVVDPRLPRRESWDAQMRACVRLARRPGGMYEFRDGKPVLEAGCILMPPGM